MKTAKIIFAVLITVIVFLIIGEVLTRIYLRYKTIYDIEMTRYGLYLKQDSDNPNIVFEHKPNSSMKLMNVMVDINSDGLRDRDYQIEKDNKYRIIFLGDSLTVGWGVKEEDTFENILEEKLNSCFPTEIINFGTGNYNTVQELNLFEKKGIKYKPDKVVLFYFINDAELTPKKSKLWFLGYSEFISFYWSRINIFIDKYMPSKSYKDYYSALYAGGQPGWENAKDAILRLKELSDKYGFQFQVVLLPELHDTKYEIFGDIYDKISLFLESNDIDYVNLGKLFRDQDNPIDLWVSYDDAHPNKIADKKIADDLVEFISRKGDNDDQKICQ